MKYGYANKLPHFSPRLSECLSQLASGLAQSISISCHDSPVAALAHDTRYWHAHKIRGGDEGDASPQYCTWRYSHRKNFLNI